MAIGDPWSAGDWASNIVFAYVITLATVLLSRRQGQMQESAAGAELIEKIAAVAGALDVLKTTCHASTAQQILVDARAGLHLLRYADPPAREEYLDTLRVAVSRLYGLVTDSVRPYSRWSAEEWHAILLAAERLRNALDIHTRRLADVGSPTVAALRELLRSLQDVTNPGNEVPLGPFEKSFRHGETHQRIRAELNWGLLRDYANSGSARIHIHREWSIKWLESNKVFSVWYASDDLTFAEYFCDDVHPIPLNDIDGYLDSLPEHSLATIDSMASTLVIRPHGLLHQVEIVTVQLPDRQVLVIDGNHRVAAICRTRPNHIGPIPVDIVEYRITAPLKPDLLPDLRYHRGVDADS